MEFLEKLYSIDNFGIYLFVVIGILVVLFLVILFFGKKDAKKRNLETLDNTISDPAQSLFRETSAETKVEAPVNESFTVNPNVNMVLNDETPVSPSIELPKEFNEEPFKEEVVAPSIPEKKEKDFDFDALAAAISKELESIEKTDEPELPQVKQESVSETVEPLHFHVEELKEEMPALNVEPIAENPVKEEPLKEEVVEPVKPRPVMPQVFSSVYVNRDVEEPKLTEGNKSSEAEIVKPQVPKFELPKIMDLPKKTEEVLPKEEPKAEDDIIFK